MNNFPLPYVPMNNIDNIITVFPDNDEKYYSTDLYDFNLKSKLVDKIELIDIKKVITK